MKFIGVILFILGILFLAGGLGYSGFLMNEQSGRTYLCDSVDKAKTESDKAFESYKAAKGTSEEKKLSEVSKTKTAAYESAIGYCEEEKSFYKTWITVGFSVAGVGLIIFIAGLGMFFTGRRKASL